jgi:hypothetical protein
LPDCSGQALPIAFSQEQPRSVPAGEVLRNEWIRRPQQRPIFGIEPA